MRINVKPISVNSSYKGRRFKTQALKEFQLNSIPLIKKQLVQYGKIEGDFELHLVFGFSSKLSDLTNCIKSTEDCIVNAYNDLWFHQKWRIDDRQVVYSTQRKQIVKKGEEFFEFKIIQKKR